MSFIYSIEGNIGSGKSTFVNVLKNYYKDNENLVFLQEPVDIWQTIKDNSGETILSKFYKDQKKYAFSFQMMAYISRISILKECIRKNPNKIIISERCVLTDKNVFAKMLYDSGNIEEVDYQIYLKWFDEFIEDIPMTGLIYIRTKPEVSYERILKRAREGEQIQLSYLENCHNYHEEWILHSNIETKILDGNDEKNIERRINKENIIEDDYLKWKWEFNQFIKYQERFPIIPAYNIQSKKNNISNNENKNETNNKTLYDIAAYGC